MQVLYCSLADNQLTSWIPDMPSVLYLDMSSNRLSDPSFESLPASLQLLYLSNNSLAGTVTATGLTALANLTVLDISDNRLTGALPNELPPKLVVLNASQNAFEGTLPSSWNELLSMAELRLDDNLFTGGHHSSNNACTSQFGV